jgi:hypothetical protein
MLWLEKALQKLSVEELQQVIDTVSEERNQGCKVLDVESKMLHTDVKVQLSDNRVVVVQLKKRP